MSPMVERIARAICRESARRTGFRLDDLELDDYVDKRWTRHRDAALSALSALEEPTGQMLFEGVIAQESDDPSVQHIFTAMIQAARGE